MTSLALTRGRFHFLGTGGSMGVPEIACDCGVCTSPDPLNKRLRTSGLLLINNKTLLVDAGPDFRLQALRYGLHHLDGMILTHTHYDHVAGIDELRIFSLRSKAPLPCLLSQETHEELRRRYHYLFRGNERAGDSLAAQLSFQTLEKARGDVLFQEVPLRYMTYSQGRMKVIGFRVGDFAYVSDIKEYDESIFDDLAGVKTLVLSGLRLAPSRVHFNFEEAVEFSRKVKANHTWLTHIAHDISHVSGNAYLPENVWLAYDGLEIEF